MGLRHFALSAVLLSPLSLLLFSANPSPVLADDPPASTVRVWEEPLTLPTYEVGAPDANPLFYTQESYQGAQKRIYPYAAQDHLLHTRIDKTYQAVHLENEYIKLTVLPELGGRLFSATDKTNNYEFFYRQHVIKPALIGMLGAWISGGIEWCAFHHHRNSTFMPIDHTVSENDDGSKTIWIGETDRRHRMKWLIGLTLSPGHSAIKTTVKFFNRTAQPHSILYWANVAVHVNDDYQIIFPPSVQVATYHSKIDFTHWPIAQGRYRGHDYTGVDISWWKNSPPSNSFFAWGRQEDFMGGYDHGKQAGVIHVADRHVVCGAKLWEWGTGTYGRAWDDILTETDGPYAELMVGAFSDNQPDYSWAKPYEVKSFTQHWYPVRGIGGFKNANLQAAVNLELDGRTATMGFHATSKHRRAKAVLEIQGQPVAERIIDIGPDAPFVEAIALDRDVSESDLRAYLTTAKGKELVAYRPVPREPVDKLPDPVKPPPKPEDIQSADELYWTGLRIEQIHNPSVDPIAYYREALRRDPGDSRCNLMLGIHYNRRGMYAEAEHCLRAAVARATSQYTRPRDAEAHYQLGLALRAQHKADEAYDQFFRASWDMAQSAAACYQLAELACHQKDYRQALAHVTKALSANTQETKFLALRSALLRKMGRFDEARQTASRGLRIDPLDFLCHNEVLLATYSASKEDRDTARTSGPLTRLMRDEVQSYLELAFDYMNWGMWDDAVEVLNQPVEKEMRFAGTYPMVHYGLGYAFAQQGLKDAALAAYQKAAKMPIDYCFPFRLEEMDVLQAALRANPNDARACYYLGNLLFEIQPDQAVTYWQQSRQLDDSLALVHRNLGWAEYRSKNNIADAIACYERALKCEQLDPRFFLELDILYEIANAQPARRLAALEAHHEIVAARQESLTREIMVLVLAQQYDKAIEYLQDNRFHGHEGREEIHDVYVDAHLLRGLTCADRGEWKAALAAFEKAGEYPENLSVGRPKNDARAPEVAYYTAAALAALGNQAKAKELFEQSAGQADTARWPETRFYQAMSLEQLGRHDEAKQVFEDLIKLGTERLQRESSADFFAKFGEQKTRRAQTASAHFLIGLGHLGLKETSEALEQMQKAVELNQGHTWARRHLASSLNRQPESK